MRVQDQPDGIDALITAVHAVDAAEAAIVEIRVRHQAELAEAEARITQARANVRLVAAGARCEDDCPEPIHGTNGATKHTNGATKHTNGVSKVATMAPSKLAPEDDPKIAKCWRIAFMLLKDPVLDYQRTAERLWGPVVDKQVAKNRVNAQLTRLKKLLVIKSLGNNQYRVDRAMFAQKSGLPLPREAAS